MKIYNSLTDKKEEFKSLNEGKINMYVCGPTVNKRTHIGHLYPAIFFDTVYRYFKYCGYEVKYASNFTDVDDKIIAAAIEEGISESEVAKRYADLYLQDLKTVNCLPVDYRPRVTEYIDDIIDFIQKLLDLGFAYKNGDDIYLNVKKIEKYGILSNQRIEELSYGNRIEVDNYKENPFDFVLWKHTNEGIKWNAPFGEGRPGWHTECVVMINKIFGSLIDIHGGGIDLKFPHHENEIAQSLALNNTTLANYWMHNGHLMIDGVKMSKSLGNVITLDSLIKDYTPNTIRLAMLKNNYRNPLSLTDELFNESKTIDDKLSNLSKMIKLFISKNKIEDIKSENKIREIMDDDLNTSNLISYLLETTKNLNQIIRNNSIDEFQNEFNTLKEIIYILGLNYDLSPLTDEELNIYSEWEKYRNEKNFEKADILRKELVEKGVL